MNNTIEVTTNLHTVTSLIGQMCLPISVFRQNRDEYFGDMDCTNGGISSKEDDLLLLHAEGFIEITTANIHQVVGVTSSRYGKSLVPLVRNPLHTNGKRKDVGPMMGGNFGYSCDSRFSEISQYPLPIHDRWDTQEDYNALSI